MSDAIERISVTARTSTDDVRRVRIDLDRRFRGDVAKLCAHAHRVSAPYARKLHLKPMAAALPSSAARRCSRRRKAATP